MTNGNTQQPDPKPNKNEPRPQKPFEEQEEQNLGGERSDTEINPGEIGNDTEVDLDTGKIPTYPKTNPPERH